MILTLLGSLASKITLQMLGWAAAAAAVLAVLLGARQSGRNAERVEHLKINAEIRREQLEAATRRPADRDELAERMRDDSF